MYRVKYHLTEEPRVSVLIPNKDHVEDLKRCVKSLYEISTYKNIEVIIIENGSEEATFKAYQELQEKYSSIKVVTWDAAKEFNYSALNNYGAKFAEGEYLLFLNNDTEIIQPTVLGDGQLCSSRGCWSCWCKIVL